MTKIIMSFISTKYSISTENVIKGVNFINLIRTNEKIYNKKELFNLK